MPGQVSQAFNLWIGSIALNKADTMIDDAFFVIHRTIVSPVGSACCRRHAALLAGSRYRGIEVTEPAHPADAGHIAAQAAIVESGRAIDLESLHYI